MSSRFTCTKNLVIDARMLQYSGVGVYLQNIIPYIQDSCDSVHILDHKNIKAQIYTCKEQVELPLKIPKCEVFWSPHLNVPLFPIKAKKRIVTIHDLYHLAHFDSLTSIQKLYIKFAISRAVSTADRIITSSEFTKNEILSFFPEVKEKIRIINLGPGQSFSKDEKPVERIPESFYLFLGNLKPNKNLNIILEAFAMDPDPTRNLVVAGKKEGFSQGINIKELQKTFSTIAKRIYFLGEVSNPQLKWLYKNTKALIFPSYYEGWGFPPVEAMGLGCPVIVSNAASIPEVCGTAALYFDPQNPKQLLECLQNLPEKKKELVEAGKKQFSRYSWKQTALEHLQILDEESISLRQRPGL